MTEKKENNLGIILVLYYENQSLTAMSSRWMILNIFNRTYGTNNTYHKTLLNIEIKYLFIFLYIITFLK